MTFTLPGLSRSLADYLAPDLSGVTFYTNPNQQDTRLPALFLRQTNARISKQMGDRLLRRLGLDLVYLERLNIPEGDSRLQAAADVMDQRLETFPYHNGEDEKSVLLRPHGRHWEILDSTLHYKFELKLWLTYQEDAVLMRSIQELNMREIT